MSNYREGIGRRDFLRMTGAAALAASGVGRLARQATPAEFAHLVPAEKNLPADWVRSLTERGSRTVYRGRDLRYIGMPVGGICAGQVFLGGDGRLWLWDIFNQIKFGVVEKTILFRGSQLNAGGGANYVAPPEQVLPFEQDFVLSITRDGQTSRRPLDVRGWADISFTGEYPIGFVTFTDPAESVSVALEAFSPFIPLNADDSGLPATVMQYTVTNRGHEAVEVEIAGRLRNPIGLNTVAPEEAKRVNRSAEGDGHIRVDFALEPNPPARPTNPPIVFDDFEGETYAGWTVTGTAFGPGPIERSRIPAYQGDVGGHGLRVVNSHNARHGETIEQADAHTGRMVSREFKVERKYIEFYIGGGNHPGKTCLNVVVDGKVVRTATGANNNRMSLVRFDVGDLAGKTAHIEIVDDETGPWGNIGVDDIVFTNEIHAEPLTHRPDVGTMSLALLGRRTGDTAVADDGDPLGRVQRRETLAPGQSLTATFVIAWYFPYLALPRLGAVGQAYARRFSSADAVVTYIAAHYARLYRETKSWHDTWYDSTLPYWFLDRTQGNTATLATMTALRFANGRFYGWEGVGCCEGTCGHVWQYAQAVGRLFPELERTVREQVDFGIAFHPDSGMIEFRGEFGNGYATDAQAGYVLRAYREHQVSVDGAFLRRVYPRAKKALEYLIAQDGNGDGIIENAQHNTLDVDLYGPSSWLTSLYLAALRAGEEMAKEMNDAAFAARCRSIFQTGTAKFVATFWNGQYFVHHPDSSHPDALRYGDGCEVDQVMGQGWAWQVGLGRIIDPDHTKQALAALYRNNFLPDVGPYRDRFIPGRWYAVPGEGGLLMCTFPQGDREEILGNAPTWASMYFNECMTGFEYEAAGHMVAEGMVEEGMAVTRMVHDRYSASKRNPWNEVECSDHYARCMAVYGVFIAACGFEYHGPRGHIGFAPRISPSDFRAAFTGAEGWGTFSQTVDASGLDAVIQMKYGRLRLATIALALPAGVGGQNVTVHRNRRTLAATSSVQDGRLLVTLATDVRLGRSDRLQIHIS